MLRRNPTWSSFALGLLLILGSACGDLTDSIGEQGRLRFTLNTDYDVEETGLTTSLLVAGHPQHLEVDLTTKGEKDISEPDELAYRVRPTEGASLTTLASGGSDAPNVDVQAAPGTYEIEAIYKGKVVDSISLTFATPDALDLSVRVRRPFETDFEPVTPDAIVAVPEGTQATFVPIPLQGERRLVGSLTTTVTADPRKLVVPGEGASFVYEQSAWTAEGNIDFYFIDPGTVTITVQDKVSKALGSFIFEVVDVN